MTISYKEDVRYARDKLIGSVIKKDNIPVMVNNIEMSGRVHYTPLGGRCQSANISEFDLEPVDLGYVNTDREVVYTMRIPARHWRQGIRNNTIFSLDGNLNANSRFLANTVAGIYPSIEYCLDAIANGEYRARAFSRRFAVGRQDAAGFRLIRKGKHVGWVNHGIQGINVTYKEGSEYLREEFEEVLNGKCA